MVSVSFLHGVYFEPLRPGAWRTVVRAFCLFLVVFLFILTIFSLSIKIDGSTIGFVGSTVKSGTTSFGMVVIVTTVNVFINTSLSGKVVSVTERKVCRPRRFCFSRVVYVLLTIVLASIILLSVFGSLKVPASAAISLMFRLLNNAITVSLVGVTGSGNTLRLNSLLGASGTFAIVLTVFLSITVTFFFKTVIRCVSHLVFAFGCGGRVGCFVNLFNNLTTASVLCFVLVGNLGRDSFVRNSLGAVVCDGASAVI